jgi:hypothetical protein
MHPWPFLANESFVDLAEVLQNALWGVGRRAGTAPQ